jgi:hypothetical protein
MTCENEGWNTLAGFLGYFPSTVGRFKWRQIPRSLQKFVMCVNRKGKEVGRLFFKNKKKDSTGCCDVERAWAKQESE